MKVVVVPGIGHYDAAANRLLYHVIVEVDEIDDRVVRKGWCPTEWCMKTAPEPAFRKAA
jgi:hypothetical protein